MNWIRFCKRFSHLFLHIDDVNLAAMTLEENIRHKLNALRCTTTRVYSNTGDIYEENRDENGATRRVKLTNSGPGYVIDEKPDLSVSKVLPWLYLGAQDVAYDHPLLKQYSITHILSIGVPSPPHNDIQNTFVEAYDTDDFSIEDIFEKCFEVINKVRNAGGTIYVHCNAGISRSPTIVAAYLIKHQNCASYADALQVIRSARPKIRPNPGFVKKLQIFSSSPQSWHTV